MEDFYSNAKSNSRSPVTPPSQRERGEKDVSHSTSTHRLGKAIVLDERGNVPNAAFSRTRSWERAPPKSETKKRKRDSVPPLNLTEGEEKYDDLENGEDVEVEMNEVEENNLCVSLFEIEGFYDVDKTGLAKPLSKRPRTPLQYSTEKRRNKINWESRRPEDQSPAALKDFRRSRIEVAEEFKSDQDETEEEEIEGEKI